MSVLDSSIAQILALDGDQRRRKRIDYISQHPEPVRLALLIPDDTTDPTNKTRNAALITLSRGFPDSGYQIDQEIMLKGSDPLTAMELRARDGFAWVPAVGMPDLTASATGEAMGNQSLIPPGAIVVTTDFDTPNPDNIALVKAFQWLAIRAPGSSIADPHGVGAAYWPTPADDNQELRVYFGEDGSKFQKLSVQYGNAGGFALLWVRLK